MHKHIILTRYWRGTRSVLGGVLHTLNQSFSILLSLSLSLPWSPVPTVVPVLLPSQLRATSVPQPHSVHTLPMNTKTVARTNNKDPEGKSLIHPNIRCCYAFLLCGAHHLKGRGQKQATTAFIFFYPAVTDGHRN